MAELEEDATEGQLADYFAAELSGDFGAWNLGLIEYTCPKCGIVIQLQHDVLPNFVNLIRGWHEKAREEGDYFSRFVFEYLAFIAHLKNHVFLGPLSDRHAIQSLKRDQVRCAGYAQRVKIDGYLRGVLYRLLEELEQRPLHNSSHDFDNPEIDKWWNCSDPQPKVDDPLPKGILRSIDDWENLVEFWYGVRNNLFHGGKDPNVRRDLFLVEHAYKTLRAFVEIELEAGG